MPELRSKARRSRLYEDPVPISRQTPIESTVRTRHRGQPAKRGGGKSVKQGRDAIVADGERDRVNPGIGIETRLRERKHEVGKDKDVLKVGGRAMDEFDTGGRNGDKGPVAEDEGTATPLPEKVKLFNSWMCVCFLMFLESMALC